MITTKNVEEAKRLLKLESAPKIIKAQDDIFNRKMLEYGHFDILLSIEGGEKKRGVRQIDSGFNHVLAALASKNNIAIGFDLGVLAALTPTEQAMRLERFAQNIQLCKKEKAKIAVINARDKQGAFHLLLALGASTEQAKAAISF